MKFLSVCSGIEAASVAFSPLGWEPVAFSEIEPFPCSVLKHHYPDVPNLGDLTKWEGWDVPKFDVLCGGTPCQGFSVAGRRGGMDDPRSQLAWDFLGIAAKHRPRWVLWENVPGVLSSWSDEAPADSRNPGERWWQTNDFDAFLCALADIGYGVAWGVMDAQYFGLAQRRNRVFALGYLGDWRPAVAVLLDRESMSGNPAPSRETGEGVAATISARPSGGGGLGADFDCDGGLIAGAFDPQSGGDCRGLELRDTAQLQCGQAPGVAHALRGEGHDASEDGTGSGVPLVTGAVSSKWAKGTGGPSGDEAYNLIATGGSFDEPAACELPPAASMAVRRLTPRECERLQGFPDDYTLVPHRGKPAADGPRYKALGNSWAVPVVRWIGERMDQI